MSKNNLTLVEIIGYPLLLLFAFLLFGIAVFGQAGQATRTAKSDPTGVACDSNSPILEYQNGQYTCVSSAYALTSVKRAEYAIASLPTCNAAYKGQTVNVTNGNKGQYTCMNTTGSTYGWVPDSKTFDVTRFGAVAGGTGGTDNSTFFAAVVTAASAGDVIEIPAATSCYRITSAWAITKSLTIQGKGTLCQTASGAGGIDVQASNVTIKDITLQGPQYASQVVNEKAIKVYAPSWASKYTNLEVKNVTAHTWGGYGIDAKWVEGVKLNDNTIYNIYYAGIGITSCAKGETQRNHIDSVTGTPNAYGIFFSRDETDSLTTDPHSTDFDCSGNTVSNIPNWEGIDTHGGVRINIHHNTVTGTKIGIQVGVSDNSLNVGTFPPIDVTVDSNILGSGVTDGSMNYGISFTGVVSPATDADRATGKITNNIVRGYGLQSSASSGAIHVYSTNGLIIKGNTIIEPSPYGIEGTSGAQNVDLSIEGNTVIDAFSNTVGVGDSGFAHLEGASNTGFIAGNKLIAGTKSATYLNSYGLRYGTTGSTWRLGINDFNAATTPFILVGTPTTLTATIEGTLASPSDNDIVQRISGAWVNRSMAQLRTSLGLATSSDVQFNRLGIGGAPSYALQIVDTVSSNGSQLYSFRARSFNSSTTSAAHYHQGFSVAAIARPAVSTTNSGYTYGVFSDAYMDSASAGTMSTLGSGIYRAYIDATAPATAVVTALTGLEGQVFNNKAGATVTTGIAVKANSTTAQTITNLYDFYAANASATNYFSGSVKAAGGVAFSNLAFSQTAPTVTSAGTSPSITASNGTAAFEVNVGTGGTATTIVLAMPTATTGWNCHATNITATAANRADQAVRQTASTTTSVTLQNQTVSTGAALAFTASDLVRCQCTAY